MRRSTMTMMVGLLFACHAAAFAQNDEPQAPPPAEIDYTKQAADGTPLNELEAAFAKELTGATLAGTFTITGRQGQPRTERYTIHRVSKLRDDWWVFNARVQYGDKDLVVPVPVQVKWAGDTPVIQLTNAAIPGLGTFTCRVLIHGGEYAGTWRHGEVGGQMFGRVEKAE